MQPKLRQLSSRWQHLAFWGWVLLMAAPLGMLALWGVWVIEAERKSLWGEAQRKGESLAQSLANLPLPRDAVPRLASLPSIHDPTFFYPDIPEPQTTNAAQTLLAEEQYERLLDGQFSGQLSSSGVPIGPLAALALFRQTSSANEIINLAERTAEMAIVRHPSILTTPLLVEITERLQREQLVIPTTSRWHELLRQWEREEAIRQVLRKNEDAILRQNQPTWYTLANGTQAYWVAITSVDPTGDKKDVIALTEQELRSSMQPRLNALINNEGLSLPALYELYAHNGSYAPGSVLITWPEKIPEYPVNEIAVLRVKSDRNFGVRILVSSAGVEAPLQSLRRRVWLTILFSACALSFGIWRTQVAFQRQQELAEQKDNFLSSVSHELRAPLGSVRLMAEGLASDKLTAAERTSFQQFILLETQRLSALVENLLDFARMEQGRRKYQFVDTNLTHLLRDTVRSLELLAAKREIRFVLEADEIEAQLDPLAIQQAIVNLLDNALKFSPNGGTIQITLKAHKLFWELAIQDEGAGVPSAEREKIFERFYRVGSELRRTTTGVGIGLSIVKHIVEGHAGIVKVEGEQGNCFRMTIPHCEQSFEEPSCES
jgi:signal transduction histidine kinase